MGLFEECKLYFGTDNLYGVLLVPENATQAQLTKAYKKCSLFVHPDRVENSKKEDATRKFQILAKVHSILSNEEQRKVYDDTGEVDEENALSEDRDYFEYWRLLFPKVTLKDIEAFMKKYKGSEEEKEDLIKIYCDCAGDMNKMSEHIMGYEFAEEDRYRDILMSLVNSRDIPTFEVFTKESKAKRNARKLKFQQEAAEAEVLKKELKLDDEASLEAAIMKRASDREAGFNSMIAQLEKKYGNEKKRRSKKKN